MPPTPAPSSSPVPPAATHRVPRAARLLACLGALLAAGACTAAASAPVRAVPSALPAASKPVAAAPAHIVVVMMENHSFGEVIGSPQAPFVTKLARQGALFTDSRAVTHPSQPNYLALFAGSTQGVTDDSCPHRFTAASLGGELLAAHKTFTGFSEGLPRTGSGVCTAGKYARKHVPWANFADVPGAHSKPFTAYPAGHYARLPRLSFVIPNLCHDMHDCSVAAGDTWLRAHLGGYATWARTHHSLLIVTWDENDGSAGNQIPTIFAGQMVRSGRHSQPITHYSVLATIENLYRVRLLGHAATAHLIRGIWK